MIKMYIGGEEVVCNKEFTIKEEMLTTSSTILNNCYPKSWEQDHDYINNFYYPQDYSQCLIYQDIPILPKEYTQVEYVQSTGTQYIDTGIKGNLNTEIIAKATTSRNSSGQLFGDITTTSQAISCNISLNSSLTSRFGNKQATINFGNYISQNILFELKENKDGIYINSEKIAVFDAIDDFTTTGNLYLFTRNSSSLASYWYGNIYGFQINNNNNLILNLIPCYRNSDKEIGFYDLVSNTFFTNQGTGKFLCGNENIETTQKLIFAGMVKNTGNISLNPRYPKYCSLEILDFKDFLSTGEYLDFVISDKTVIEAIQMTVDAVAKYGFILGNVNIIGSNDVIGAYSTQEKSAYDVFQYLADITGSRWTTRMVDENTIAIDFYDPTLMPQGQDIDYTQEWWESNQVNDLVFNYGTRDYRNKQIMLSNQVFGGTNYTETIIADGYNKSFITSENIGSVQSIYINGSEMTVITETEKELGIDADFYYSPGNNVFSGDVYAAGTQILITYTPLIKGREVVYNSDEVVRINTQLNRKGVVSRYEQRNDVLSSDDLEKIGQTYIKYKGSAEILLKLTTQVDIYNIGELIYFNAPISELAKNYMVKTKSTQIIATGSQLNIWYTYELTSSFNSENAINWFDNQRNKVNGNISEGEYITRNIDIENTVNIIWDNLTITEVTPVGDNIINAPLNSPFIQ